VIREKSPLELKARWAARGYGEVSDNIYASVLPAITLRILLVYAAANRLDIRHIDVVAAFLYSKLDTEVFMEQPHGMEVPGNMVCRLKKAIYGLCCHC
jgi:hypothetical protein